MPDSLVGLLLFLAGIGPGYVFLRVAERREPRQARSALLEFAELFVIGSASTAAAALLVLLVGSALDRLKLNEWLAHGRTYVVAEPTRALVAVGAVLVLSYLGAWAIARFIYRGRPASIRPEFSVWFQVFHVDDRSDAVGELRFATIELKDGRRVGGYVHAYSMDPDTENREIALRTPIFAQADSTSEPLLIADEYLIIPSDQLVYVSVQTQTVRKPSEESR